MIDWDLVIIMINNTILQAQREGWDSADTFEEIARIVDANR